MLAADQAAFRCRGTGREVLTRIEAESAHDEWERLLSQVTARSNIAA